MPIDCSKYSPDWPAISRRIRARAGQKCERCRAPNGQRIARSGGASAATYMLEDGEVFDANNGRSLGRARGSEFDAKSFVTIVITVAHLDQDTRNDADDNLAALCQRCHLNHDRAHNLAKARATRERLSGQGRLF